MKTTDEKIKVMQAYENGATISMCSYSKEYYTTTRKHILDTDKENIVWNWNKFDYDIAPDQVSGYVNVYPKSIGRIYTNSEMAREMASDNAIRVAVKVVEVWDE